MREIHPRLGGVGSLDAVTIDCADPPKLERFWVLCSGPGMTRRSATIPDVSTF